MSLCSPFASPRDQKPVLEQFALSFGPVEWLPSLDAEDFNWSQDQPVAFVDGVALDDFVQTSQ